MTAKSSSQTPRKPASKAQGTTNQMSLEFFTATIEKQRGKVSTRENSEPSQTITGEFIREPMRMLALMKDLSVLERRLYWWVLNKAKGHQFLQQDTAQQQVITKLSLELHTSDIIGSSQSHNVAHIKNALRKLGARQITWEVNGLYTQLTIFPKALYYVGKGRIILEVHEDLIPGFLHLGNSFSQIELEIAMNLTSTYAQLLYSYFSRHAWRGSWEITVKDLLVLFGLEETSSYKEFNNLRRRVLAPAIQQIEELSGLRISFVERTQWKKVVALLFTIQVSGFEPGVLDEGNDKPLTSREYLDDFLAEIRSKSVADKLEFAQKTIDEYYRPGMTQEQRDLILTNLTFLDRFCICEAYVSSGLVEPKNRLNYVLKGVFNPEVNSAASARRTSRRKNL